MCKVTIFIRYIKNILIYKKLLNSEWLNVNYRNRFSHKNSNINCTQHAHTYAKFSECMLFYNLYSCQIAWPSYLTSLSHSLLHLVCILPSSLQFESMYVRTTIVPLSLAWLQLQAGFSIAAAADEFTVWHSVTAQKRASKRWLTRSYSFFHTTFVKNVTSIYKF